LLTGPIGSSLAQCRRAEIQSHQNTDSRYCQIWQSGRTDKAQELMQSQYTEVSQHVVQLLKDLKASLQAMH